MLAFRVNIRLLFIVRTRFETLRSQTYPHVKDATAVDLQWSSPLAFALYL